MNNITILDNVLCKADRELIPHIAPCLKYPKSRWREGQYNKEEISVPAYFIHKGSGVFLTGLLPRVAAFLKNKDIPFEIKGQYEPLIATNKLSLDGITLRPDQITMINLCVEKQRGLIICPTRYGKTVVALGFMSMFPKAKILFLCNTLDIISQTVTELERFNFRNIAKLGGGSKDWKGKRIVVSTIQTFVKQNPEDYADYFDITIVDEAHHCVGAWNSNKKLVQGQYGTVMCYNDSPVKIGFTATPPTGKSQILSAEGLLGPIIGEMTQDESIELKITMKPIIELIPVPYSTRISSHRKYRDLYQHGIVDNRIRNKLICKSIKTKVSEGKTVLVMVKEIQHGLNIQSMAQQVFDMDIDFVRGSTDADTRQQTKDAFQKRHLKAVISTAVWREGVNIPSLNCTINAIGGKSEIMTLQSVGRGLTKVEGKTVAEIVDFLDPYRYLAEHCILRLSIYAKNNWL